MTIFQITKDNLVPLAETRFDTEGIYERKDLQRVIRGIVFSPRKPARKWIVISSRMRIDTVIPVAVDISILIVRGYITVNEFTRCDHT